MTNPEPLFRQYLDTPIGTLEIAADDTSVRSIYFVQKRQDSPLGNDITQLALDQLAAYFNGQRQQFSLPLGALGTAFQQQVWLQLSDIPYGSTCSYADIARQLNNPKAVRAVGAANGKNPISIVVPCHRVIGANGKLTGYAGGLDRKSWLLRHEQQGQL
ncbi:methylated-DNA--[protein]-cysteine S-methyltransferase [Aliiglaciecola litoralis]|uniref:Methylated-DNA--protein-cysteine methyltransferase n=1 Tax=Aliiglaciecola litoralis TaxID=582857 RepID=A0ABN1LEN7_9ALTE